MARRNTVSLLDREQMYPGDRLKSAWAHLADRERLLLAMVAERLLLGQKAFGPLARGKRKWKQEGLEEMLDGIVYIGCELMDLIEKEKL